MAASEDGEEAEPESLQGLHAKAFIQEVSWDTVLTVGGRYICGDPQSLMPAWRQPDGPLNYRQIEELIAWITASDEVIFEYDPAAHGEVVDAAHAEPTMVRG